MNVQLFLLKLGIWVWILVLLWQAVWPWESLLFSLSLCFLICLNLSEISIQENWCKDFRQGMQPLLLLIVEGDFRLPGVGLGCRVGWIIQWGDFQIIGWVCLLSSKTWGCWQTAHCQPAPNGPDAILEMRKDFLLTLAVWGEDKNQELGILTHSWTGTGEPAMLAVLQTCRVEGRDGGSAHGLSSPITLIKTTVRCETLAYDCFLSSLELAVFKRRNQAISFWAGPDTKESFPRDSQAETHVVLWVGRGGKFLLEIHIQ